MKKIKIFNTQEDVNAYYVDGVIPSGDLVITRTEKSIATTTNNLDGITEYISGEGGSISVDVPTKLSQLENDTNFITAEDVEQIVPAIPTKVSELENDVNYITEHQSLEDYAKKEDIPTKVSELENDSNFITEHQSLEDYATKEFVQSEIENASIGGDVDLSDYAKKEDIPTDYLTSSDIQDKADKSEIPTSTSQLTNDSGFITSDEVNNLIQDKADRTEIPTDYLTSSDIQDKADRSELDEKVDKSSAITMTATLEDDTTVSFTIYGEQQ